MSLTVTQVLSDQLEHAHQNFLATLNEVTDTVANFQPSGIANSIGSMWAHLVVSEDYFVAMIIAGGQPLVMTTWSEKTGLSEPHPMDNWATAYPAWTKNVRIDTAQLLGYTKAVFAASEEKISSLTPELVEEMKDMSALGSGQMSVASILDGMVIGHCHDIMGEISALKGIQGLKGYPW